MEKVHNFLDPPLSLDVLDFFEFGKNCKLGKILILGTPKSLYSYWYSFQKNKIHYTLIWENLKMRHIKIFKYAKLSFNLRLA